MDENVNIFRFKIYIGKTRRSFVRKIRKYLGFGLERLFVYIFWYEKISDFFER